jgi:pimeloyl-ACP methyl ester carboxylesterase
MARWRDGAMNGAARRQSMTTGIKEDALSTAIEHTVTIEDADIYFEERGAGPPLLLLHGLTGTSADWQHVFDRAALAREFRVISPDARGHGRSTSGNVAFSFQRCARDVIGLLDKLGIERVRALGMSLGAKTLLHVATLAPGRVERMILVSATPRFPETTRALFRTFAAAPHSPEEWTAMRAQHVRGDEQIAALWRLPAAFADDSNDMNFTSNELGTIAAATLIVAGDRDPLYPVELAVELYRGIPRSSLWVVPNGGHGPIFNEEREDFVRRALPFLRE